MARVPKIDQPCPLPTDEQRRMSGHCSHCNRHVHALDGLDDSEREALLSDANGSICVMYSVQRSTTSVRAAQVAGIGVALAATLSAWNAAADEHSVLPRSSSVPSAVAPQKCSSGDARNNELVIEIFVGGVRTAEDASWVDDSTLAELPIRVVGTDSKGWGLLDSPTSDENSAD